MECLRGKSSTRSTNEEKTRFPGRRHQLARTQTSHSAVLNENIATLNVHSNVRILWIFLIFDLNISKSLTFCNNAKKCLGVRGTLTLTGNCHLWELFWDMLTIYVRRHNTWTSFIDIECTSLCNTACTIAVVRLTCLNLSFKRLHC